MLLFWKQRRVVGALERSVEAAALRAVQQYLLGEMDFVEEATAVPEKKGEEEDSGGERVGGTK